MVKAFAKFLLVAFAVIQPTVMDAQSVTINVKDGEPVTLQTSQIASITFTDNINEVETNGPKVGDFYYSDGTWSSEIDDSRTAIGVVFYTGDPTAEDHILKADHPECTHGLVISAFANDYGCMWQNDHVGYANSVGSWISENLPDYISTESNYGVDDIRNSILGYNNTKALRAFNLEHFLYSVVPVDQIDNFESEHPAPATSSGWYLPSIKELFILINGVPDNEEILDATTALKNRDVIDNALSYILGAHLIYNSSWAYDLWSSNEFGSNGYTVCTHDGRIEGVFKDSYQNTIPRYVLAF